MSQVGTLGSHRYRACHAMVAVCVAALLPDTAFGTESVSYFSGAAVGSFKVEAHVDALTLRFAFSPLLHDRLNEKPFAFGNGRAGIGSIALFGAELNRIGLEHAIDGFDGFSTEISIRDANADEVLSPPIRSPGVDVYAIAGVVPMKSVLNGSESLPGVWPCPGCGVQPLPPHPIDTSLAGGAGARLKLGAWGLRVQCGRFMTAKGHTRFVSVGFTRNVF